MTESVASETVVESAENSAQTEAPEVPAFKFPEENWEDINANPDDYPARKTLLAPLVLAFNAAMELRSKYLAVTDIESGVGAYVESNQSPEFIKMRKEIDQANKLIAKHRATMEKAARDELMKNVDPDFDEAKVVAHYNDYKASIKTDGKELFPLFRKLNHIEVDVTESGAVKNPRPATDYGHALLTILDLPKLSKDDKGTTSSVVDPAVTARNKAAKEWGSKNGWTVKDKGRPEAALLEAFAAAGSPGL